MMEKGTSDHNGFAQRTIESHIASLGALDTTLAQLDLP